MTSKSCPICGTKLNTDKRPHAIFCSSKCRKKSSVMKKRAAAEKASRSLNPDEHADCMAVYTKSKRGYKGLMKLLAIYGKDFMLDVLLVVEDVIGDISPESEPDEKAEFIPGAEMRKCDNTRLQV
ncbi:hypothetical protein BAC3_01352 [uncultured bacterium]|nr:hypothetical protein BAC3_01352 [uncultured bacterium]